MGFHRRRFLALLLALGASAGASRLRAARAGGAKPRVVIIGAGVAGTAVALALRRLIPAAEIAIIERAPAFVSRPSVFDYLLGEASWSDLTRGHEFLTAQGIKLIRAEVEGIEPARQRLVTTAGPQDYELLVVASGIRLADEEIKGLAQAGAANASLYDPQALPRLRERLRAYRGGTILLSIPPPPHQCPPAPYEFALLLAAYLRQRKLSGKIVVLDANSSPQPAPLAATFDAEIERQRDLIDYVPAIHVAQLDAPAHRVVSADGESFGYDLLSLIPPQRAARFIEEARLAEPGDPFVEVNPLSFRSTRFESIYAVGDAARTPYARTAAAASGAGLQCAHAIARALGGSVPEPAPAGFTSPCYPYVGVNKAMRLEITYRLKPAHPQDPVDVGVSTDRAPSERHAGERKAWERELLRRLFAG